MGAYCSGRMGEHHDVQKGVTLSWENITFTLEAGARSRLRRCIPFMKNTAETAGGKQILHGVSGSVPPSQLLAVMGSSGAGKTTFLNALAQQLQGGVVGGNVLIDGELMTKSLFRKYCGYVRQDDVLLPNLTVRQTIEFYAALRLPKSLSRKERRQRVDETLSKLGLNHCQHSPIGGEKARGISGGEKRRVSIAVELIRNPTILFLDEPTSGLDARTSLSVIETLADLAHNHGHTIVCTIHQPRNQAFNLFDRLFLLARGREIYSGPISNAATYFEEMGYECPAFENPADFYIDLLTIDSTSIEKEEESKRRINDIIERSENNRYVAEHFQPDDHEQIAKPPAMPGRIMQTYLITKRSMMNTQGNPGYLIGKTIQAVVMAIAIAILWWQIDNDQSAIQDRAGVVFIVLLSSAFPEAMGGLLIFPQEREIFRRERRAGMYPLSAYYLGKQIAEFPLQVMMPALFATVVYWLVGLPSEWWIYGTFLSLVMLMAVCVSSAGMLLGAIFPLTAAVVVLPCLLLISLLFAGFYVHPDNIPVWVDWVKYISLFFYAYMAVMRNQFEDLDMYCKSDQFLTQTASGVCPDGEAVTVTERTCPITNGDTIVNNVGADLLEIWQYQLILLGFVIFVRLLIYPALKYASPREAGA